MTRHRTRSAPRMAVDIGGTFTDTVLHGDGGRMLSGSKTLTTKGDPTAGAIAGARRTARDAGLALSAVGGFIHGTTLATNALIERRGARVACITTAGFRDILEIAYERRYDQYDLAMEKPDLIVLRRHCFTIAERMSVAGDVVRPLDEAAVPALLAALEDADIDAVAVCFLHSYANPAHELRLRDLLLAGRPDLSVSLSCEVSPEAREFERLCTTVANAYIQPLMAGYLRDFAAAFAAEGLACPILMMTAGGGMTTLETAARFPVRLVESGPAGGAVLAARIAASCGADRVLSFDMGGTTAKLCLIDDQTPRMARSFEIARAAHFIKGSGMPVRIPTVEMIEIGAGGGSIAGVDGLGRLMVGPESAGSEPGPAAFGRGGTRATVSDADIALGLIAPEGFAEGRLALDGAASAQAIRRDVGEKLNLDTAAAAMGISDIVDENMAAATRTHCAESGTEPEGRVMIAFGGNGPLHATRLARRAGLSHIIVPADPGVGSAAGFLYAPVSYEIVRSMYMMLDTLDITEVNALLAAMQETARNVVAAGLGAHHDHDDAGNAADDAAHDDVDSADHGGGAKSCIRFLRCAFMRYGGQGHEIAITLPDRALTAHDRDDLRTRFEAEYRRQFTRIVPGMSVEILNWSVQAVADQDHPPQPRAHAAAQPPARPAVSCGEREIFCDLAGVPITARVYRRADLVPGMEFTGPALITEPQTTTLVSRDFTARIDGEGHIHLHRQTPEGAS